MAKTLDLIDMFPTNLKDMARNDFEKAYSQLSDKNDIHLKTIEDKVYTYFNSLKIPDSPNLYDYLILSLRKKDLIATFNWDPFLTQSYSRLHSEGVCNLPECAFLHGNVSMGVCLKHNIKVSHKNKCPKCGKILHQQNLSIQ
ncbi:hypothetical protein M1145_00005 [Patescibacteria group bacterium]|nr:hypothetical protein [Patescibacteria group bacterium]